jgi:GNAT superfamily N-acetyltransferase
MAIVIHSLTPDTVDEALAVYRAVLGAHRRVNKEAILDRLQSGAGVFYGAFDAQTGEMVGIKFGYIDGGTCVGRGIAVLPAYRRQGIGTKLLRQFEQDLAARPDVSSYVFGSSSGEGVPFHLAMGYRPRVLIQFEDPVLRGRLDLADMHITHEGYNAEYHVYQVYAEPGEGNENLAYLRQLEQDLPGVNVGFQFSKSLR